MSVVEEKPLKAAKALMAEELECFVMVGTRKNGDGYSLVYIEHGNPFAFEGLLARYAEIKCNEVMEPEEEEDEDGDE